MIQILQQTDNFFPETATSPGEPMFSDVITRMFPPSLRSLAEEQSIPDIRALFRLAASRGGC